MPSPVIIITNKVENLTDNNIPVGEQRKTSSPMPATQRYKLVIAYRGSRYHGWQFQWANQFYGGPKPREGWGIPTVQELVQRALGRIVGHPVKLSGSSRTDAGVHAKGQVAHFDTTSGHIPAEGLRRAANAKLPEDILIRTLEPVPDAFDATRCAVSKRYQYLIWNHDHRPVFLSEQAWHRWHPLDVPKMRQAAAHFVGRHDFTSFARPKQKRDGPVRTVLACDVHWREPKLVIGVEGTGFLWNMVRIMVGTLVEVGMGRIEPDAIVEMLAAKDRRAGGPTAPPHGLYLQWIRMKPVPVEPPQHVTVPATDPHF